MIVRLTDAQRGACCEHGRQEHRLWLHEQPVGRSLRAGKTSWDVLMPPIGWRTLLDRLEHVAFNEYGQRRARTPGSVHRAAKRIALRLARLEAHPAFTYGVALPGEDSTVFVAWSTGKGWSPYPVEGQTAVWLTPNWHTAHGMRITLWSCGVPTPGWNGTTLDPAEHLAFTV